MKTHISKAKYIKYNTKIRNIITSFNQLGGAVCHANPNHNHHGECWHDTLQTVFIYSAPFNDIIQAKLLHFAQSGEFMTVHIKKYIEDLIVTKGNIFLPPNFDLTDMTAKKFFINECTEYISRMVNRFIQREKYEFSFFRQVSSDDLSVESVKNAHNLINHNKLCVDKYKNGGSLYDIIYMMKIISYLLLDGYYTLSFDVLYDLNQYVNIDDANSIILSTSDHATAFITCNDTDLFYNDNLDPTMKIFNWKKTFAHDVLGNVKIIDYQDINMGGNHGLELSNAIIIRLKNYAVNEIPIELQDNFTFYLENACSYIMNDSLASNIFVNFVNGTANTRLRVHVNRIFMFIMDDIDENTQIINIDALTHKIELFTKLFGNPFTFDKLLTYAHRKKTSSLTLQFFVKYMEDSEKIQVTESRFFGMGDDETDDDNETNTSNFLMLMIEKQAKYMVIDFLIKNFNIDVNYVDGKGNTIMDYVKVYQPKNFDSFHQILNK